MTISGTPPTEVAIAGVPTASASTSVCGKFSQAEESSAASARAEQREHLVARERAEEPSPPVQPEFVRPSFERRPLVSVAGEREVDLRHLRHRLERDAERLRRGHSSREREQRPLGRLARRQVG